MKIILTGGTGLIGRKLAAAWIEEGHEVIALTRRPNFRPPRLPQRLRLEGWDGRSAEGWGHLAEGADAIVNLAGENIGGGRWTHSRKAAILQSRLNAGQAVVDAVTRARLKPGLVIQISGVDYYGVHAAEKITEEQPAGKGFLSQVCEAWEDATRPVEQFGVRRVIVRSAVVLAREGGAFERLMMPFRFFVGGALGSGRQWFSWIHMNDEVAALDWLLKTPSASGVYNLCSPNPLQNRDLAKAIGAVMRRPAIFPVPAPLIRLLFGEMAITVLGGQRAIPARLLAGGYSFLFPDIESALRDLLAK